MLSQQAGDGSFGATTGEPKVLATVEALETLRAAGQGQTPAAHSAELFLAIAPPTQDAEVELRRELALAPTGQALSLRVRTSHATGFEHKDALHLALTLRNDIAAGRAGEAESFQRMLDLKTHQLPSGCWRWADSDDSVELTSDAVRTLRALLDVPTEGRASNGHLNAALDEGARCLRSSSSGALSATAMRLEALLVAPGASTTQIADARTVLAAAQASDGSIGSTVRTTAIAVRGLLPGKPDWRIVPDDFNRPVLAFDDANPLAGVDAVARLNIDNRSGTAAPATTVRILLRPLDGGAEITGAEARLGALAAGASAALAVHIPSAALQGRYSVRAVVDPDHLVAEISEANNEARQLLNVRAEADLSVVGSSIRFTPVAAGQTRVEVTVRNLGIPLARSVSVGVWKGNPSTGGVRIGGATLAAGIPTNGTGTVSVAWDSSSASGPTVVTAVVDESNVLPEADRTNNAAFRFYYPGSDQPVDLAVADADVAFTPSQLHVGDPVTFTAVVKNLSSFDASRVPVVLTDLGGPILAQTELPFVPAHGSAVAGFRFAMMSTSVVGRIQVDPAQQLNDSDRSNNLAAGPIALANATPDVDFNVLSAVDRFPSRTVEVLIRNNGTKPVATTVELFDITHGKSLGSQPIVLPTGFATTPLESLSFSIPADTSPAVLRACADPSNVVAEPNENDNCAEVVLSGFERVDLITHSKDLRFSPVGAAVGEKVHVTATVHNQDSLVGPPRAAKGVVEFWHSVPGSKAGTFLGTVPFAVNASSDVTVDFDWVREDGPVELCVRVAQVQPADQVAINNIACRNLFLEQVVDLFPTTMFQAGENLRVARLTGRQTPEILVVYEDLLPNGSAVPESGLMVLQRGAGGTYAPLWSVQMPVDTRPTDLVVADLDGDGAAEVVLFTAFQDHGGTLPSTSGVTAYRADGSVKWTTSFVPGMARPGQSQRSYNFGTAAGGQLSVGDVNGDGVADIVTVEEVVRVFSGDDGHLVWSAPNPAVFFSSAPIDCRATVLDVDGDGTNEVFSSCGEIFLLSSTGSLKWTNPSNCTFHHQVIDLDLDGSPEGVVSCFGFGTLVAVDLRNGAQKARTSAGRIWDVDVPFGPVLQDGLPYVIGSDNSFSTTIFGFRPSMDVLWQQSVARPDNFDVYAGLLVDLLGLGRPQFVASSPTRPLLLQDGRDGRLLLEVPLSQFGSIAGSNFTYGRLAPVVADLGTGHASVLVTRSGARGELDYGGPPHDGAGEFLIMSSPHWTKQPALWATRVMRHGQIDETTLKVSNDYRWWTSHNTWQQQYDVAPAKLLPDLTVALAASPGPGTAGEATTLTATVTNLGGAPATTAMVSFFDGAPSSGGKEIGTAPVAGIVAGRGGTATATLSWTAFPEGEHLLFAVAGGVEESGTENNSARLRTFVQPGTRMCDAAVDGSTLVASPAQPSAGQAVQLSATVGNLGPIACPAHGLTVRDGAGGDVLGTVSVPLLAPGAQAIVAVAFRATPGTHLFRVIADEARALQDGDLANNVGTLMLDVLAAAQPDYTATSIALTPSPARAGEQVTARVTVKNQGAAVTAQTRLEVSVGAQTVDSVSVDALGASESKTYTVKLVAPSAATAVVARVDAEGALAEFDETNNVRSAPLAIESSGLVLTGSATPSSALPDTPVRFTVLAQLAPSTAKEVLFDATLLGAGGAPAATVASGMREVIVPGSSSRSFTLDTGRLAPDTYRLHVTATSGGRRAAALDIPLTVLPGVSVATTLSADRGTYAPGADAVLTQRLTNTSRNVALSGASLVVRVLGSGGAVLYTNTRPLAPLAAGASTDTVDLFSISPALSPGAYQAEATVVSADATSLGVARASFSVAYQPADTVRGVLSAASPFGVGPPLAATVQLSNPGALAVTNGSLDLSLVNAVTLSVEATATKAVSVAAGGTTSVSVSLSTTGLLPGQKLLVARLGSRTLDRLQVTATAVVDVDPPAITVSGVTEGQVTNQDVTPTVLVQDQSPFTTAVLLDGQSFSSGIRVTTEAAHILSVSATDVFGNASQRVVHFTIDKTPPTLSLSGPADGALVKGPVTLSVTGSEPVTSTLNGQSFPSGGVLTADGSYRWTVTATDAAGNTASEARSFVVDSTPPTLTVTGVADGDVLNHPVTVRFAAADAHPATSSATLDGAPFSSGSTVSVERSHLLVVTATDDAGNRATKSVSFALDMTPPAISVGGITAGALTNVPVTITFEATDAHAGTVAAVVDGAFFTSGSVVSAPGDHLLVVTAVDTAGNSARRSVAFTLDFTPPVISLSGVTEGATGSGFTPVFSASDAHSVTVSATLDGADFLGGTTVSASGAHVLVVTAVDAAGNRESLTRHFTVGQPLPIFHYAVCATGMLAIQNNATVSGAQGATASAAADGSLSVQNNARISGSVVAGGSITLQNNALVDGTAYHGGAFIQQNGAVAAGGHQQVTPPPAPCECGFNLSGALADAAASNDNALLSGNPAFRNNVLTVPNNATLTLAAGRYYLSSLELKNNAKLTAASGAQVQLYVQGSVKLGNNSTLGAPVGSPPMWLLSGATAYGRIEVKNNADAALYLYAPNAPVTLADNAKLHGAVVGKDITLSNNQSVVLTGFSQTTPPPLTCH